MAEVDGFDGEGVCLDSIFAVGGEICVGRSASSFGNQHFVKNSNEADYWMLCYNGSDNPAVVAECYYGKSKVVFQEPLFERFKEDIYE